jgi:hypothetical protein
VVVCRGAGLGDFVGNVGEVGEGLFERVCAVGKWCRVLLLLGWWTAGTAALGVGGDVEDVVAYVELDLGVGVHWLEGHGVLVVGEDSLTAKGAGRRVVSEPCLLCGTGAPGISACWAVGGCWCTVL